MDSDIQRRRAIRAENAKKRAEKAEAVRLKGNEAFKKGEYLRAGAFYMDALEIDGPRPMLLSNLAACYNKLKWYEMTEDIATRALEYDPRSLKARYRRAMARLQGAFLVGAKFDFEAILAQDPSNVDARRELNQLMAAMASSDVLYAMANEEEDEEYPEFTAEPYDFAEDSDTEDCKHKPERPPCRFYNRGTCDRGYGCRFSHAPDNMSVRDELGRNVCSAYLMGLCNHGEDKCVYSHSRAHLPARGWWNSPEGIQAARRLKPVVESDSPNYPSFFRALRENREGQGYAARRARQLLNLFLNIQFGTLVADNAGHSLIDKQVFPHPPDQKFILVVDFDYNGDFPQSLHHDLFTAMSSKIKLVHVRSDSKRHGPEMTLEHLGSPHIAGVLVTDERVIGDPQFDNVSERLVQYAKNGGTVVLGGKLPNELRPKVFDTVMKKTWGVGWKYGSYFRTTFALNTDNDIAKANKSLLPSYSMKALHVAELDIRDAVYKQTPDSHLQSHVFAPVNVKEISKREEAPAVFSKVGKGHLGFVGDVNVEAGSIKLTMAMLGILDGQPKTQGPVAAAATSSKSTANDTTSTSSLPPKVTDKCIVVLDLNSDSYFEYEFEPQLNELRQRINVKIVHKAKDALKMLSRPDVHGVYIADSEIALQRNAKVLKAVAQYAKDGGLVVVAGNFPGDTGVDEEDVEKVFSAFGLPWTSGATTEGTITLNTTNETVHANSSLPKSYSALTHNLQDILWEDLMFLPQDTIRVESPVLRAHVGKGYVGYIGDMEGVPESTKVLLSMFELLHPPKKKPARDEEKFMLFITSLTETKARELALGGFLDDVRGKDIKVIFGLGELSKPRVVDLLASPDLVGVFVGDAEVLEPEHEYFLSELVRYSKRGGTLILGWMFPEMLRVDECKPFFWGNWGLDWEMERESYDTVMPNHKNPFVQETDKLPKRFEYSGVYMKGIQDWAALYRPQSKALWEPLTGTYMSSILFTEVGNGKLGYIGTSSTDGEIRTIIKTMMGIV